MQTNSQTVEVVMKCLYSKNNSIIPTLCTSLETFSKVWLITRMLFLPKSATAESLGRKAGLFFQLG